MQTLPIPKYEEFTKAKGERRQRRVMIQEIGGGEERTDDTGDGGQGMSAGDMVAGETVGDALWLAETD